MSTQGINSKLLKTTASLSLFLICLLLQNCQQEKDPSIDYITYADTVGIVGYGGGEIIVNDPASLLNGVKIVIPEGAVKENTLIKLSVLPSSFCFDQSSNSLSYTFKPDGLLFDRAIQITLPFTKFDIEKAVVFYYDSISSNIETFHPTSHNSIDKSVTFETNHFSEYVVVEDNENPCFKNHCTIPFRQDYLIQNDIPKYNSAIPISPQSIFLETSGWCGWNYNYSSYQRNINTGPIGYPHILYGKNPCSELPSTCEDLPCQLNSISNLYVEFDAEFNYSSDKEDRNLVLDIWLTNSETPTAANITGEIMIWDYKGTIGLPDSKTFINSVNIEGIRYDLWRYIHGDFSGCEVYNFLPASSQINTRNRKINIADFISALVLLNQLQSDQKYISSITFGNEVWYGIGSAIINHYNVTVNKISDIDANKYKIVRIGNQNWMAENLKTTRYQNGDLIGTSNPINLDLTNIVNPKYQWAYGGNESNVSTFGRLYTWNAVTDSRKLCPAGWHVPSDDEWHTLALYLDNNATLAIGTGLESEVAGGKLKEAGNTHWRTPNTGASDNYGFTALPAGNRDKAGSFIGLGTFGVWWTSTETSPYLPFYRLVWYSNTKLERAGSFKQDGFSVRCIKD